MLGKPVTKLFIDEVPGRWGSGGPGRFGYDRGRVPREGEHPFCEGAKPEATKHFANRFGVDWLAQQFGGFDLESDISHQSVELPVSNSPFPLIAQIVPNDPGDFFGAVEHSVERPILGNPLDGCLLPHLVDTNEVVARFTHQRRNIGVAFGWDAITFEHCFGGVPLEFAHPPSAGIEHGDLVIDKLKRVTVPGDDEYSKTLVSTLTCERRDDVVCLVVLFRQSGNPHRVQRILEEGYLADKFWRSFTSGGLVFRVNPGSEGKS